MRKFYFIFISLLIFNFLSIIAQESNYQIKKIDGKEYLMYPVQPGEGLYAVARKFNVTVTELNSINPKASEGLKNGQIILVPSKNKSSYNQQIASTNVQKTNLQSGKNTENKSVFITHIVEKKQTMFAICKMYEISQAELIKQNPELENGLKTGMILKIPVIKKDSVKTEKAEISESKATKKPGIFESIFGKSKKQKTVTISHIVKPKETLYAISRLYNISVEDIVKLNPSTANGLVIGTELKLDVPKEVADTIKVEIPAEETQKPVISDENKYLTRINNKIKPNENPFRIALILPLVIENSKTDAVNERFQEFYAGFLIAVNEAKKRGVSLTIFTFESGKSEESITEILQKPELKLVDLIVGPAYSNQIPLVSEFALTNEINTVIPFSSRVPDINSNPYLFQFNPSYLIETEYFSNLMLHRYKNDNLILVNIASVSNGDNGTTFLQELKNKLRDQNRSFNEIESTNVLNFQSAITFEKDKKNILVFNTDKYSSVFPFFNYLNSKSSEYEIVVFEQYSWKNQTNARSFNTFSIAPFKPLLSDQDFTEYNSLFEKYFKWKISSTSPRYDVLGYDMGNYFIALLYEYGPRFNENRNKLPFASGVQSFIKFERNSSRSGFINKQLYQHEK